MAGRPLKAEAPEAAADAQTPSPWRSNPRRRGARFPEKREALLGAAAVLFRERGYDGASLNELADRLSITKPTLYYYVKNKDDLLRQVIARGQGQMLRDMREIELGPGTAYEKLRAIMIKFILIVTSDYGACLSLIGTRSFEAETEAEIRARVDEGDAILYRVLSSGQKDGSLQVADRIVTLHALFGSLNWVPRWYKPDGRLPPARFAKQFVDILLSGVRPTGSEERPSTTVAAKAPKAPRTPKEK